MMWLFIIWMPLFQVVQLCRFTYNGCKNTPKVVLERISCFFMTTHTGSTSHPVEEPLVLRQLDKEVEHYVSQHESIASMKAESRRRIRRFQEARLNDLDTVKSAYRDYMFCYMVSAALDDELRMKFEKVKDYIVKYTSIEFQESIESRFKSLLNGTIKSKTNAPVRLDGLETGKSGRQPYKSVQLFIDIRQLMDIYHDFDCETLVIDFRPPILFRKNHISLFTNIINIDPISIKEHYTIEDIRDHSFLLASREELELFGRIREFQYVVLYDQASRESDEFDHGKNTALINFKREIGKHVKNFSILEGGFEEWVMFMDDENETRQVPKVGLQRYSRPLAISTNAKVPCKVSIPIISGLYNLGNSCYMNSVIQVLIGTRELTDYILEGKYEEFVAKESKYGTRGGITKSYERLAKEMRKNSRKKHATKPDGFKREIGKGNKMFDNTEQQDAGEFLQFLLDAIHEDLNLSSRNKHVHVSEEDEANRERLPIRLASTIEWERYLQTDYSIIVDTFSGQYASRLECDSCHCTSTTFIPFNMLSIPIPVLKPGHTKTVALDDCLREFTKRETLKGDDVWECPKLCKGPNVTTSKKLTITRLPPVLIIHLERFTYKGGAFEKDNKVVDIPHMISMDKYWPSPRDDNEVQQLNRFPVRGQRGKFKYVHYGTIRHYGTLHGGHYTSDVDVGSQWIGFDDERVGIKDKVTERDGSSYIVLYRRV